LIRGFALALAAFAATSAYAKQTDAPVAPMSASEQAAVQLALNRAEQIYAYDQAAWHTTDALTADIPKAQLGTIRGWVVTPDDQDYRVTYYSGDAGTAHRAVYSAVWTGTEVRDRKLRGANDAELTAEETRLAAASDAVSDDGRLHCANRRFNRVVLPGDGADGADLVYLLTPQLETGIVPLGGHHRIEVKDGKKTEALVVSHLLDPTPTEIHAFSVYAARKPIFVITTENDRIWASELSGGRLRIRLVK
jgi:hypothetical protein